MNWARNLTTGLVNVFEGPQQNNLVKELPYWDIIDGVMFLESGRAEVGVKLHLPPTTLRPPLPQIKNMLRTALRNTPQGSRVRFYTSITPASRALLNTYIDLGDAEEPAAQMLADERAKQLDELRLQGLITDWNACLTVAFGSEKGNKKALSPDETASTLNQAKRIQLKLERFLENAGLNPKPLSTQDVYELVYRYFNPDSAGYDVGTYVPTQKAYPVKAMDKFPGLNPATLRKQLLKSEIANGRGDHVKVGRTYHQVIVLDNEPEKTRNSIGNIFLRSGLDFSLVLEAHHEDYEKAIRRLKQSNATNYGTAGSEDVYVDSDVEDDLRAGRGLMQMINQSGDHVFRFSAAVILRHTDLTALRDVTQRAASNLASIPGNPFRILSRNTYKPFKMLAPFNGEQYHEFVTLLETNVAQLFPCSGPYKGSQRPVSLYLTRMNTLAAIDSFDTRNKNWHSLILGKTRSGKTFMAQKQLSDVLRDASIDARIVDRGLSWKRLVDRFDGDVIPIETGGEVSINPFDLPAGMTRPNEEQKGFLAMLLRAMIPTEGGAVEADEDAILVSAIEEAYESARSERKDDLENWVEVFEPFILTDFAETLLSLSAIGDRPIRASERDIAASLARRLQVWTGDTPLGRLVDAPTTLPDSDARVVLYETSSFNAQPKLDAIGTMLIQRAIWNRAISSKSRRMVMAVDEAWALLNNVYAVRFLVEMLRRGAKEGVAVWLLTHTLNDITGEKHAGVFQALSTFIIFQLMGEDDKLQELLRLSGSVMRDFKTISGRKGIDNEFLFYTEREDGPEGDILSYRPSRTDYWTFTNHADDLRIIEERTNALGSETAAIRELSRRPT